MPIDAAARPHRTERVLVVMASALAVVSLLAIVAVLIAGATRTDVSTGVWPAVVTLPLLGFPLVILLIVAFFIVSAVRRSREARDAG